MFRTIFSVALIGAANAVSLHKEAAGKAPATALDIEEVLAKAQSGDYTTEDVEKVMEHVDHHMKGKDVTDAIDWAAEQGVGFDEIKAMIEGVEVSQAFDKHDIYDFAMDACCHFQVTEKDLDEMLHYAGKTLGIDQAQFDELLDTAGEVFDISQEEFDQAVQDCFVVGAKCAAKAETDKSGETDKKQKEEKEPSEKDAKKEGKKNAKKAEKKSDKKGGKKGGKGDKTETKLAESDFQIEDLLEVDLESLTPEDVKAFLEENGEKLQAELEAKQADVVAFVEANAEKIEAFVAENKEEMEDFAKDLEELVGDIDWDAVKAKAEAYFAEGKAKLEEKKRQFQDKKAAAKEE